MNDKSDEIPCYFNVQYCGEVKIFKIPWEKLSFDTFRSECEFNFEFVLKLLLFIPYFFSITNVY